MKTKELQDLLEYFGREQACYTSLLDLSRSQKSLIEQQEMDELLVILGRKQQILGRISEIEEKLKPYKRNWPGLRESLSEDDRGMVDAALSTVEEILAELIDVEQECETLLRDQMSCVQKDLGAVQQTLAVQNTYGRPQPDPRQNVLDLTET